MQRNIALVALAVIGVSALIGSAAFTTGSIDRTATIGVVGDDTSIVGLAPDTDSTHVSYDGNNELRIDFTDVNADATYYLGDSSTANTTYAFTITNNDGKAHDFSLSYVYDDTTLTGSPVTFDLYNDQGASVSGGTATLQASEVAYVVVTIDTHGLTNGADLSGTLTVKAN